MIFFFLIILLFSNSIGFGIRSHVNETKSMSATVFASGGCEIERVFEKNIPSEIVYQISKTGRFKIIIEGIEDSYFGEIQSFRATIKDSKENESNLEVKEVKEVLAKDEEGKKNIEIEIKNLENQIYEKEEEKKSYEKMLEFYEKSLTHESNMEFKKFSEIIKDFMNQTQSIRAASSETTKKIIKLKLLLSEANIKLQNLFNRKIIEIELFFPQFSSLLPSDNYITSFLLSYHIQKASWSPYYILDIDSLNMAGKIDYSAIICQSTEYDWVNAKISLSDAQIHSTAEPPQLNPISVGFYSERTYSSYDKASDHFSRKVAKSKQYIEEMSKEKFDFKSEEEDQELEEVQSWRNVKRNSLKALNDLSVFQINEPITVPKTKDGEFSSKKISVVEPLNVSVQFNYLVIPQKSLDIFQQLLVSHNCSFEFLSGPLTVNVDSKFLSRSKISPSSFKSSKFLEIWIRKNTNVGIVFKQTPMKAKKETTLFLGKNIETRTIETRIENRREYAVNISILDALPFPKNERISVSLLKPTSIKLKEIFEKPEKQTTLLDISKGFFSKEEGKYILKKESTIFKISPNHLMERIIELKSKEAKTVLLSFSIEWNGSDQLNYDL